MIQASQPDHIGKAVSWLIVGVVGGLLLDLCAKELLRTYSLQQFILFRSLIATVILLAIAPRFGGLQSLRSDKMRWHVLRTVLAIGWRRWGAVTMGFAGVFDKAEKAESVAKLKETLEEAEARVRACNEIIGKPPSDQAKEAAEKEKQQLESRVERLSALIARKEKTISET